MAGRAHGKSFRHGPSLLTGMALAPYPTRALDLPPQSTARSCPRSAPPLAAISLSPRPCHPPLEEGRKEGEETGEHDQSPHHHPQGSRARAPALARAAIKQPARLDGAGPRAAAAQQGPGHRKGSPRGSPGRASLAHPAPSKTADGRKDHRIGKTGRPRRDLGHRFEHDPRPRGRAEQGPLAHPRPPQKRTKRSPKPPPKPGSGASRVPAARLHHGPPSLAQHSPGTRGTREASGPVAKRNDRTAPRAFCSSGKPC